MKIPFITAVLLAVYSMALGESCVCRTELERAADCFIWEVFTVSKIENHHTSQERQALYREASDRVMGTAGRFNIPTDQLKEILNEYLVFEEATREPPPGWEPNDRKGNIMVFHDIAKKKVHLDLSLISYGRRFCYTTGKEPKGGVHALEYPKR